MGKGANGFNFRPVRSAPKAHPLVKQLIAKMNEQGVGVLELCEEAGIGKSTYFNWADTNAPTLPVIEACFNVLGYTLQPQLLEAEPIYQKVNGNQREYVFTSPGGEEFRALGMREFCAAHNLNLARMYTILVNPQRDYHGWKVRKGV